MAARDFADGGARGILLELALLTVERGVSGCALGILVSDAGGMASVDCPAGTEDCRGGADVL